MEQRSLRVAGTDKNFFSKITSTITKILIPTRVGINGMLITLKRNALLKAYEAYEQNDNIDTEKSDNLMKKYEDCYALYLESIDKYIIDSVYKKVKNDTATEFEKSALARYYVVTHLKETQYLEYKYEKQKYLLELDYETVTTLGKEKNIERYNKFYISKMDTLYKGLLKNYSIQIADRSNNGTNKSVIYDKIFNSLEKYITNILPIKIKYDNGEAFKEILDEYDRFNSFTVGKLDQKDILEKKMVLLGISRHLFTHSLPLVAAEQCYIKLLKDTRNLIVDTKAVQKRKKAYELLLNIIEDYNVKLLSTKVYWDKPDQKEAYKEFWNAYKDIQKIENQKKKEEAKEVLFIKNDLIILNASKKNYEKIIQFYKTRLVYLGAIRQLKNTVSSKGSYIKVKKS